MKELIYMLRELDDILNDKEKTKSILNYITDKMLEELENIKKDKETMIRQIEQLTKEKDYYYKNNRNAQKYLKENDIEKALLSLLGE